jgi:hypothetical protein
MRRRAYILILIVIWAASVAALALGLDGLEHPPFVPTILISGAYFGAITTVCLAEEVAEGMARKRNRAAPFLVAGRDGCKIIKISAPDRRL